MAKPTISALMRASRPPGTRPLFMEKAATSQYSQNAAQPMAKTDSTACMSPRLPPASLATPGSALSRQAGGPRTRVA